MVSKQESQKQEQASLIIKLRNFIALYKLYIVNIACINIYIYIFFIIRLFYV